MHDMDPKLIREKILEKIKSVSSSEVKPETMDELVDKMSKATEEAVSRIINEIPIHSTIETGIPIAPYFLKNAIVRG